MKKLRILILAIAVALCICSLPTVAHADTGPKPFLDITVTNLPKDNYSVMFLCTSKYCGPTISVQAYEEEYMAEHPDRDYTQDTYKYQEYLAVKQIQPLLDENETYYLLIWQQQFDNATELEIHFGYYPPQDFKLVIYSQSQHKVWVSAPAERYAFASYFKLDFADMQQTSDSPATLKRSYNYGKEIIAVIVRVLVTVAIELGLAFAFRFDKKSLIIIAIANIVTQLLLNLSLNLFVYNNGVNVLGLIPMLLFGEIIVLLAESATYRLTCKRLAKSQNNTAEPQIDNENATPVADIAKPTTKRLIILYTLIANLCSLGFGVLLWFIW